MQTLWGILVRGVFFVFSILSKLFHAACKPFYKLRWYSCLSVNQFRRWFFISAYIHELCLNINLMSFVLLIVYWYGIIFCRLSCISKYVVYCGCFKYPNTIHFILSSNFIINFGCIFILSFQFTIFLLLSFLLFSSFSSSIYYFLQFICDNSSHETGKLFSFLHHTRLPIFVC